MSPERNRKQNARLIATGARLKLEGVVYVQGHRWAQSSDWNRKPGTHPDQIATTGQSLVQANRVSSPAARDVGPLTNGVDAVDTRIARNMKASRAAMYAEEELVKRMKHLLENR